MGSYNARYTTLTVRGDPHALGGWYSGLSPVVIQTARTRWAVKLRSNRMHPRSQPAQKILAELIVNLRSCSNVQDGSIRMSGHQRNPGTHS